MRCCLALETTDWHNYEQLVDLEGASEDNITASTQSTFDLPSAVLSPSLSTRALWHG